MIRSDNGTNFVGGSIELKNVFGDMDEKRINDFLMELGGEWISWKRNSPMASNMGGVRERQILYFQLWSEIMVKVSTMNLFVHYWWKLKG